MTNVCIGYYDRIHVSHDLNDESSDIQNYANVVYSYEKQGKDIIPQIGTKPMSFGNYFWINQCLNCYVIQNV